MVLNMKMYVDNSLEEIKTSLTLQYQSLDSTDVELLDVEKFRKYENYINSIYPIQECNYSINQPWFDKDIYNSIKIRETSYTSFKC